jgi:acyl-CoA thioester hydrolase
MSATPSAFFELNIDIQPQDIDQLGHVNNVVYLRWIQDVAEAHWNTLATQDQQKELAWVVIRHEINYHKPAFPGDQVLARTWVGITEGFRSVRHVELFNEKNQMLVSALTTWCLIDPKSGRPKKITDEIHNILLKK